MEEQKNLIGGMLIGGAVGLIAGFMLAPQAGPETRKKITKKSNDLKEELLEAVNTSMESFRSNFNDKIDQLANNTKEVVNKTTSAVSDKTKSVH